MRPAVRIFVLLLVGALLSGCAGFQGGKADPRQANGFSTVLIDAGHGGKDRGGAGRGLIEKEMALDTAIRLREALRAEGFRVILTRDDDRFIELDDRVALANRRAGDGTILLSIHYNAGPSSKSGAITFFWRTDSHGLATRIQRGLVAETGLADGGIVRRRLRVTRNPEIASVLIECGFLTNAADASRIAVPEFRQRIARGIARGLREQRALGDGSIAVVPELNEPMSRGSDAREY